MPLGVAGDHLDGVVAGVVVEQPAVELGGVISAQPGGHVADARERRRVRLAETKPGEGRQLLEDGLRRLPRDAKLRAAPARKRASISAIASLDRVRDMARCSRSASLGVKPAAATADGRNCLFLIQDHSIGLV